ncbi:hypothetical protein BJX70DRAFT_392369 [Aspergillus crustosus]
MLPTSESMLKRRRLLRGEITYSAAKENETNILHALGYWDQQREYFEHLRKKCHLIEATVAQHLNLSPKDCHVPDTEEWLSGTFNVCIPIYIGSNKSGPGYLIRLPLPYRVGDRFNPGNADEKVICEVGTYLWLQQICPEIPIPKLHGYGLATGQMFSTLENLPFLYRTVETFRRRFFQFLGHETPSVYSARSGRQTETIGVGYLLIEYIDQSRGRMLSESWDPIWHPVESFTNPLPGIGSFVVDEKGIISLSSRPLTLEIQQLENESIPVDIPREFTYSTVDAYVNDILASHESRLRHQPNALNNIQDGLFQIAALTVMRTVRQIFFCPELRRGPFFMSLTDLHQSNILVDENWKITSLVDLEWACSRPAEMIHPPYWLTSQSVDNIDATQYGEMHSEFMLSMAEQEQKYLPSTLQLRQIMQDGWKNGTFWYCLALDSPSGLFRIFYDHIQPKFSKDHLNDASFFQIIPDYWTLDMANFLLLEAFK